jgi:hypothetical protein
MKTKLLAGLLLGATISFNVSAVTVNSVDTIINDMALLNDEVPYGIPTWWNWATKSVIHRPTCPSGWSSLAAWGGASRGASNSPDTNTRIQIKNIKTYIKSRSTGRWQLLQSTVSVGGAAFYPGGGHAFNANTRKLPDGSVAIWIPQGYVYHFWPTTVRPSIDGGNVAGVFVTYQARLIIDDTNKPDDRGIAKYVSQTGADWWSSFNAVFNNFKTNTPVGISRAKYITSNWQSFNFTSLPGAELRSNPPPID